MFRERNGSHFDKDKETTVATKVLKLFGFSYLTCAQWWRKIRRCGLVADWGRGGEKMGMDWVLGVDNYWPQPLMATGLP